MHIYLIRHGQATSQLLAQRPRALSFAERLVSDGFTKTNLAELRAIYTEEEARKLTDCSPTDLTSDQINDIIERLTEKYAYEVRKRFNDAQVPLSQQGEIERELMANKLSTNLRRNKKKKPLYLYSSPLRHAADTADAITSDRLGREVISQKSSLIQDLQNGDFWQRTHEQRRRAFGKTYEAHQKYLKDGSDEEENLRRWYVTPPFNGESVEQMVKGIREFAEMIKNTHSGDDEIALVTHSFVIAELQWAWVESKKPGNQGADKELKHMQWLRCQQRPNNCSILLLQGPNVDELQEKGLIFKGITQELPLKHAKNRNSSETQR